MFQTIRFFFFGSLLLAFSGVAAQSPGKYGHMNLGNLLESMPQSRQADSTLKILVAKLKVKGDSLGTALETAAAKLQADYDEGLLTPVQAQEQYAVLQKQDATLQAYEKESQQTMEDRRNELLQPILLSVEEAVKAVAKENGYLLIFDTSTGAMLFVNDTDDVTALVRKKLGI